MARFIAIDYGLVRVGLAVTDPLQLIASGLCTLRRDELTSFLDRYVATEPVAGIVLGEPRYPDGNPAQLHAEVLTLRKTLEKKFPTIPVYLQDERFSSVEARQIILSSGANKKKRKEKGLTDKIAAALVLETFMERKRNGHVVVPATQQVH